MQPHNLVALVTVLALIVYLATLVGAGRARGRYGVEAPATTGHPEFERYFRVQMNTLESLVLFIPSLWLFAHYWSDLVGAALGLVWVIGRVIYMLAYVKEPKSRALGFGVSSLAGLILLAGAGVGAVWGLIAVGGI